MSHRAKLAYCSLHLRPIFVYHTLGGPSERLFVLRCPLWPPLVRKGASVRRSVSIERQPGLRAAGGAITRLRNHNPRFKRGSDDIKIGEWKRPTRKYSMDHAVSGGRNQYRGESRLGRRQRRQDHNLFLRSFCRDLCSLGREPNNHPGRSPCDRHFSNLNCQQE